MLEIREYSPPILKTLMAGSLGGDTRDSGAPTTYPKEVDGGPPGRLYWRPKSAYHLS
jgi:hypothetical protein